MFVTATQVLKILAQTDYTVSNDAISATQIVVALVMGVVFGYLCGKIASDIGYNFGLFFGFGFLFGIFALAITGITAACVTSYRKKHGIPNPRLAKQAAQGYTSGMAVPQLPPASPPSWDTYNEGSFICPICNSKVPSKDRICWNCGTLFDDHGPLVELDTGNPAKARPEECPKCAARIVPGSSYCNMCGYALNSPVQVTAGHTTAHDECPVCGALLLPGAHFCNSCGHMLESFVNVERL